MVRGRLGGAKPGLTTLRGSCVVGIGGGTKGGVLAGCEPRSALVKFAVVAMTVVSLHTERCLYALVDRGVMPAEA